MGKPNSIILSAVMAFLLPLLTGCSNKTLYAPYKEADAIAEKPARTADIRKSDERIDTDLKRLNSYSAALADMAREMDALRKNSRVWENDYFGPREHDLIENLIFRYLLCRKSLWEMVHFYINYRDNFSDPVVQTKGFLVGFSAGLHIVGYSSLLVATFVDEPPGKAKINEAYPRSEIPAGTYDTLFRQVTSVENLKAVKIAWELFTREFDDSASLLRRIYEQDPQYRKVVDDIRTFHGESERRIEYILREESLLLPEVTNQLRHSGIAELAESAGAAIGDNLYAIRGFVFTAVGDIKSPAVNPLVFTAAQKKRIQSLLRPGDVILTYSAGYMSNIFLPGHFKHAIAYIGSVRERKAAGLTPGTVGKASWAGTKRLDNGHKIDVIEAVSEGVIFNSLDYLLSTHINRMVVLRPLLSPEERNLALADAFALLGIGYDFKFDFNDGSYQCCTEVIYRMLNSRGPFKFALVKRAGVFTLTADDIVDYFLSTEPKPFAFVLFADEDPANAEHAALYASAEGEERFRKFILPDKKE